MPTRRRRVTDIQLALPFPEPTRPRSSVAADAVELVALHDAVRLVLGVAEGRVEPSAEALESVFRSLGVLAAHHPRGRLGHVVRRYGAQPMTEVRWPEFVDELAFVLSIAPEHGMSQPEPTYGGLR